MKYLAFCDESGIQAGSPCYTIAAIAVPESDFSAIEQELDVILRSNGVDRELHWSDIRSSQGAAEAAVECFRSVIGADELNFAHAIAVLKAPYKKWQQDREEAFYQTYTYLLQHLGRGTNARLRVFMDERSDSYDKRDEVMQIISTHMLRRLGKKLEVESVEKVDSHAFRLIQLADIWGGAINQSCKSLLEGDHDLSNVNPLKREIIAGIASVLGWKEQHLAFDTMPPETGTRFREPRVNIWHFPYVEFRSVPGTRPVRLTA